MNNLWTFLTDDLHAFLNSSEMGTFTTYLHRIVSVLTITLLATRIRKAWRNNKKRAAQELAD